MAEEDRSVAGTQGIPAIGIPPLPDGTIDAADRRHMAGFATPGGEQHGAGGAAGAGEGTGGIASIRVGQARRCHPHTPRHCRRRN